MTTNIITEEQASTLMRNILLEVGRTHEQAKAYIDAQRTGDIDTLREEFLAQIETRKEEFDAYKATMETFRSLVDAADLDADGEINLTELMTTVVGKVELNQAEITRVDTAITNIQSALNDEIAARTAQGVSLQSAIDGAKTDLTATLDALTVRVDAIVLAFNAFHGSFPAAATALQAQVAGVYSTTATATNDPVL